MSTIDNSQSVWSSISKENLNIKHEKCLNITEEIYKRINITFQIKKLENAQSEISDNSDHIDSNDLSNETDLFACDKSDSIPSSTETEKNCTTLSPKYININNNEETKGKKAIIYKRPKKRFRKRVKKHQTKTPRTDSDDSDEALPLSRMVEIDTKEYSKSESPDNIMGVPKIVIVTKDLRPRILSPKQKLNKEITTDVMNNTAGSISRLQQRVPSIQLVRIKTDSGPQDFSVKQAKNAKKPDKDIRDSILNVSIVKDEKRGKMDLLSCSLCTLSFRGEKGLRRHMTKSHMDLVN